MGSLKSSKNTPKSGHFNSGRTRTRPCIYCGAFFFDFERLRKHEETEAMRFREEREKIQREKPRQAITDVRRRDRVAAPVYQPHHQYQHQFHQHQPQHLHHLHNHHHHQAPVHLTFYRIDRTVEEFGEDWEEDQIYPPFYSTRVLKTKSYRQVSSHLINNNNYDKLQRPPGGHLALASLNPVRPRPIQEQDYQSLGENSWITFEPTRMPPMPASKIVVQSRLDQYLSKLNEEEWVKFIKEQLEPSPPLPVEDPNRMDCRHCGLIFNEVHVRKFHEESHTAERDSREELTCGYCGKMFSSLTHKKIHERAHQSLEDPEAAPIPAAVFDCELCGRKFTMEAEMREHNQSQCTASRPARPVEARQSNNRPRLADQEGWNEDQTTLPHGWKVRTRPRATQAGQLFFLFLSPDQKVFHSRKKVMEHMESLGGYSQFDFDKVREGAKNPRKSLSVGRKHDHLLEDDDSSSKDSPKPKMKRKSTEEDWTPRKKKASNEKIKSEDEEKENKTEGKTEIQAEVKTKRSKRSRTSFQKYF